MKERTDLVLNLAKEYTRTFLKITEQTYVQNYHRGERILNSETFVKKGEEDATG